MVSAASTLGARLPTTTTLRLHSLHLQGYFLPGRKHISWIFPSSEYISTFKFLSLSGLISWLFDVHLPISHHLVLANTQFKALMPSTLIVPSSSF